MKSHFTVKGKTLVNTLALDPDIQSIPLGQGQTGDAGWLRAHPTHLGPGTMLTPGAKPHPRDRRSGSNEAGALALGILERNLWPG